MKRVWIVLGGVILAACASQTKPEEVTADYLQKRVSGDIDGTAALACAAWEEEARLEAEALANRAGKVTDLTCQNTGKNGEFTNVLCEGQLSLSYQGEVREQALRIEYQMMEEDGEWKVCGEAN